jgi:O-antigen ligase/tetratricopeptide (TPR) repeat protein
MRISANRRLTTILIFFLLEGLITLGWFNRSSILPDLALSIIVFASSVWIIKHQNSVKNRIGVTPLFLLLSAYTLYRFVSIFFAPLPLHAMEAAAPDLFQLILFGVLLVTFREYWKQDELTVSVLIMAGIFTSVNLLILGIRFLQIVQSPGAPLLSTFLAYRLPGGFLLHPNFEAAFLNLVVPFALIRWHQSINRRKRTLWSILILSFLVVEYFCSSRGAWLSLLLSGSVTISMLWLARFEQLGTGINQLRKLITPARIFSALLLIALAAFGFNRLLSFEVEQRAHLPISTARTAIWSIGLDVIRESPWLGSGPGSFHYLSAWFSNIPPGFFLSHAHNVWIQIVAESGIPGLLLALSLAWFIILSIARSWNTRDYGQRIAVVPIAGAMAGLFLHNLVDFTFDVPLISFLFICFLVILDRNVAVQRKLNIKTTAFCVLLMAGSILFLVLAWWNHRGSGLMAEGVAAAKAGSWTKAADLICGAEESSPGYTFYEFQCGLALATLANQTEDVPLLEQAKAMYQHNLRVDPYWPIHRANLAALEFSTGENALAIHELDLASQQATHNVIFRINLGWMYERSGEMHLAANSYEQALLLDPWLVRSSFMRNSAIRRSVTDSFDLSEIGAEDPYKALTGWMFLDNGDYKDAESLFHENIEANPTDAISRAGMALALFYQEGLSEQVTQQIELANFYAEGSYLVQDTAGALALHNGDFAQARAAFLGVYDALSNRNDSVNFYASTYPRPFLPSDAVPQLLSLPVSDGIYQHLLWLADDLEQSDRRDMAVKIRDWIEVQRGA